MYCAVLYCAVLYCAVLYCADTAFIRILAKVQAQCKLIDYTVYQFE